jgi:glycosyltransferase involved in cell wall biosynthesis
MKLLLLSCHSVLEFDEYQLLTGLGADVFSHGAYIDPAGHHLLPRPGIAGAAHHEDLAQMARLYPKTNLPDQMIDWADVVLVMHTPEWISCNWKKFRERGKRVIWRSIGQSTPRVEQIVRFYRQEGLQIIRYSPKESLIKNYAGQDALIRFYKDPQEFGGWNGNSREVINFTQSLKGRRTFCHHDDILKLLEGFNGKVYGTGNDDLGALNGGELPYKLMKKKLQDARAFIYGGTWPASYTLSFIEAMMIGIPIVALGQDKAENIEGVAGQPFYEVHEIIRNGENGYVSDNIDELKGYIDQLVKDQVLAQKIGQAGRETAIKLFGKENIKEQWKTFLGDL